MSNIINTSTLEFYNYGENNMLESTLDSPYKVKISDKDGNIITIEKDGALYACVGLQFDSNSGVLTLVDVAHDNAELATVDMPNADYIYNCRFDQESNSILFDVKSLYGDETSTIELNVDSIVELYEAGQGIAIGEKGENGRKPISIKLAEGENILQLSDAGLSISDKIATDEEVETAVSGKADISYVDERFNEISGLTGDISSLIEKVDSIEDNVEKVFRVLGTEEEDPSIDERIDSKADLDEFNDLENEVGELEVSVNTISGDLDTVKDTVEENKNRLDEHDSEIESINDKIDTLSGDTELLTENLNELSGIVENNETSIEKITSGLPENVKEAYILTNKLGEQLGEQINIYENSSIETIEFVHEDDQGHHGDFLKIVYINTSGEENIVYIDISEIIIETEFADGLEVNDSKVSVKIDPTSDEYLTVSPNGVKLSGISEVIAELINVDTQQWSAITQNRQELEAVDTQLWSAISDEISARERTDAEIGHSLEQEILSRISADTALNTKIETEASERIAGDSAISASIDTKITEERERAIVAETNLGNRIDAEERNRHSEDERIEGLLNQEITDRTNADTSLRNELLTKISSVSGEIAANTNAIAQERTERMREDDSINSEISSIKSVYAKKEYVDSKDIETRIAAVNSATTLANEYSDLKNSYLEAELKLYCDSGHTQLQTAISENTTKINAISSLKGVSGTDISNYDDTGNGILDVLHKEFHQYKGETIHKAKGAQIRNEDEIAIGRYNISNKEVDQISGMDIPSGCTIFSIGIGTSDSVRKNALEVRQDGSVYMWVEGEYVCINNLLGALTHETY